MIMATFAPSRPGVHAELDARFLPKLRAPLHRAWTTHRTYRRTLAELRKLSIRQREALGFAALDPTQIARRASLTI